MTSLDEFFDQYLNRQLAQKIGTDYSKICNNIDKLIKGNNENVDEIKRLKLDIKEYYDKCKFLQDTINEIARKNNELEKKIAKIETLEIIIKQVNDRQSQFGQLVNNKLSEITQYYNNISQKILILESNSKELSQKIIDLEVENKRLSQRISEKESKNNKFQGASETSFRNDLLNISFNSIQNDRIIKIFNEWAAHPISIIPSEFAYLIGDFRIRTKQQELSETQEETKWIINRVGEKKYLLPNPNFFDQMTNISELYKMDLNMLKVKGKNKINIITPCEISSSGFIELPGELKFL